MRDGELQLRSFRVVFDLERRIHKVDQYRIPLPYGLPLRSIGYAVGTLLALLLARHVPGLRTLLVALPTPVRFVAIPCFAAWGLTQVEVDGRSAHVAGIDITRYLLAPRRIVGWRPAPPAADRIADLAIVSDERSTQYRRAIVRGPSTVLLRGAFTATRCGNTLAICPDADGHLLSGQRVSLRSGQRLEVTCAHR